MQGESYQLLCIQLAERPSKHCLKPLNFVAMSFRNSFPIRIGFPVLVVFGNLLMPKCNRSRKFLNEKRSVAANERLNLCDGLGFRVAL